MMTAVRGSMAPKIDVRVGPMCLIALTRAMLEMAVAGPDSWFSHLAVETNLQANKNTWLEPIDDNQYAEVEKEIEIACHLISKQKKIYGLIKVS